MLGDRRLQVVVHHPGLHDTGEVLRVDLDDRRHPRKVEKQAPVDGVGTAGEARAGAARDDRRTQLGGDPNGGLHLALGAGAQREGGTADGGPRCLVGRYRCQHSGVRHQAVGRQLATERLEQRLPVRRRAAGRTGGDGGAHRSAPRSGASARPRRSGGAVCVMGAMLRPAAARTLRLIDCRGDRSRGTRGAPDDQLRLDERVHGCGGGVLDPGEQRPSRAGADRAAPVVHRASARDTGTGRAGSCRSRRRRRRRARRGRARGWPR